MFLSLPLTLLGGLFYKPIATPIVPANDGTGTQVEQTPGTSIPEITPSGQGDHPTGQPPNHYIIRGGSPSNDGSNLFHSFEHFGLNTGSTATFISPALVNNIFGRVVGGQGSLINGTLRITGSDASLFLLNPAGVLFGPNAQLDLPAAFTATTATGISFGGDIMWDSTTQNYGALMGTPQAFQFGVDPGSIINLGQLSVVPGGRLSLLSGIVVNRGVLFAPGGEVMVVAVPGGQLLRFSAPGQVLSLELERSPELSPLSVSTSAPAIAPLSLGELLTGAGPNVATDIQVDAAGRITLSGRDLNTAATSIAAQPGDAIASGKISAASATGIGGTVAITGDRVIATAATIQATGPTGGGQVYLGGTFQGGAALLGARSPQPRLFNAEAALVDRTSAIDVSALERGDGGTAIVWADGATGFSGAIAARGGPLGGNGGFVEVSGREQLGFTGAVDLGASRGEAGQLLLDPRDVVIEDPNISGFLDGNSDLADQILAEADGGTNDLSITPTAIEAALNTGDVTIQATRDITVNGAIASNSASNLSLEANENITVRSNITLNGGNLTLQGNADTVDSGAVVVDNAVTLSTNGGDISATGTGSSLSSAGVTIMDSTLNAGTDGSIFLNGQGGNFPSLFQVEGVIVSNSNLTALGLGTLEVSGTGGTGSAFNDGVTITNSQLQTEAGEIHLQGTGGMGERFNDGVELEISDLSTQTGPISITGFGGVTDQGFGNRGVVILDSSLEIRMGDINITINGDGGSATGVQPLTSMNLDNHTGVALVRSSLTSSPGGDINIAGQGGTSAGEGNLGVFVVGEEPLQAPGGAIAITGQGGNSTDGANTGIEMVGGAGTPLQITASGPGGISLDGRGGSGSEASVGIRLQQEIIVEADSGSIALTGQRGATGPSFLHSIDSQGDVQLNAIAGDLTVESLGGPVRMVRSVQAGGKVSIVAPDNVTISGVTAGQNISVTSSSGNLTAGNVEVIGPTSGDVALFAQGSLTVGTISTQNAGGRSGNVTINSQNALTFRFINSLGDTGGSILLNSAEGNIYGTSTIFGGVCNGSTLCSSGTSTINHGGQNPFTVGNIARNGTTGTIQADTVTLALGQVIPNEPGTFREGLIQVSPGGSNLPEPIPAAEELPSQTKPPQASSTLPPPPLVLPLIPDSEKVAQPSSPEAETDRPVSPPSPPSDSGVSSLLPSPDKDSEVAEPTTGAGGVPMETVEMIPVTPLVTLPPDDGETKTSPAIAEEVVALSVDVTSVSIVEQPIAPLVSPVDMSPSFDISDRVIALGINLLKQRDGTESGSLLNLPNVNLSTEFEPSTLIEEISTVTTRLDRALAEGDTAGAMAAADALFSLQFADYLEVDPQEEGGASWEELLNGAEFTARVKNLLATWGDRTGKDFAILYPIAFPDRIELLLQTGRGQTIRQTVFDTDQSQLRYLVGQFRRELTNPFSLDSHTYRPIAQRLRQYLITPVEEALKEEGIDSLLIVPGPLLRSVSFGALMAGDRFLIQDYDLTLVPSFRNIESYVELERRGEVLAMGASSFVNQQQQSLPFARAEALAIPQIFGLGGNAFTNEAFTEANFIAQRQKTPYQVVHLATHANFRDGGMENSYIQFWDDQLSLAELGRLNLGSPPLDLLILSACRTAVGSAEAELGFAGLTIKSGVRTAIASQWEVNDEATMILMVYFYHFLNDPKVTTKAEALQRAQLFLLENRVEISNTRQLILPNGQAIALSNGDVDPTSVDNKVSSNGDRYSLDHPFYWAAFTAIGSPW